MRTNKPMQSTSSENLLLGKTALVTGAGGGIGYAIADRLLASGASVALHYLSSHARVVELIERYGEDRCLLVKADFATPSISQHVFEVVWEWHHKIDVLVNNAALIKPVESTETIVEDDLNSMMAVNYVAPFLLTNMILSKMCHIGNGHIVSISSIGVKYAGSPESAHYMASKAALEAGTLALAKVGASSGVMVNVLRAGVTRTLAHKRLGRQDITDREALIPLGRSAEPSEIAEAVLFLVSPLNTYLTGAVVPVAGGE